MPVVNRLLINVIIMLILNLLLSFANYKMYERIQVLENRECLSNEITN